MDLTPRTNNHQLIDDDHRHASTDHRTGISQPNPSLDDVNEKSTSLQLDMSPIRLQLAEDDYSVLDIPHITANDDTGNRLFQSIWIDTAAIEGSEDENAATAPTNPRSQDHDLFVLDTPHVTSTDDAHEDNHFRICVTTLERPNNPAETTPINQQLQEFMTHVHDTGDGDHDWITSVDDPPTLAPQDDTTHHVPTGHQCSSNRNETIVDQHQTSLEFLNKTSRNLLAPVSKASYKTVPYEILHLISTHLDGHSLSRLNCVDRASHAVTSRKDLWAKLLRHPWNGSRYLVGYDPGLDHIVLKGIYRKNRPREFYVARYQIACQRRRFQLELYELDIDRVKMVNRSYICHYLNDVLIVPTIMLMFILFIIFLIIQISLNQSLTWFTCWPLIIIALLLLFISSLLYYKRWGFPSGGFLTGSFYYESTSLFKEVFMELLTERDSFPQHSVIWFLSCLVSIFLITLSLKLVGLLNESAWYKIFTPIYIVLGFSLFTSIVKLLSSSDGVRWRRNRTNRRLRLTITFHSLFLTFIILLNVYLDAHPAHMRTMYIFIPLFVIDLLALIRFWQEAALYPIGCLRWLVVFGPFVSFKILVALKLDGVGAVANSAWSGIFIPLYLPLLGCCLIWIFLTAAQRKDFSKTWQRSPDPPDLPLPDK